MLIITLSSSLVSMEAPEQEEAQPLATLAGLPDELKVHIQLKTKGDI